MKQMLWICALGLTVAAGACGKKDKDKNAPTGDNKAPAGNKAAGKTAGKTVAPPMPGKKKLPAPDTFVGKGRIVNVYVDGAGKGQTVDVWAKRSFRNAAVKLAEGIEVGKASDWFGVPKGQRVLVVPAGAGADDKGFGGIFAPKDGEFITGTLMWQERGASIGNIWETKVGGGSGVEKPPAAGKGVVVLRAYQLKSHEKTLGKIGTSFLISDGKGNCIKQRMEADGKKPAILGGTNPTVYELAPGKTTFHLHGWMAKDKCKSESLYSFDVEVKADKGTLVVLYSPDSKALAHTALGMELNDLPAVK